MNNNIILETQRLILRKQTTNDAEFIFTLLNTPSWLQFIGDRNVKSIYDAKEYIESGVILSYEKDGFGFWAVLLKDSHIPIGICGLVKRENLQDVEVGFALLPEFANMGYGFECASATMDYAKRVLNLDRVVGITDVENIASIKLLNKIGLQFEKTLYWPKGDEVLFFSTMRPHLDQKELDRITAQFFELFTNEGENVPHISNIKSIFIPEGVILNGNKKIPEVLDLDSFIAYREEMLTNGTLIDFSEREITHETKIYKNIAQRFSLYEKSGNLNGKRFSTKGMKTIQFIRVNETWKMSSVAWADDTQ